MSAWAAKLEHLIPYVAGAALVRELEAHLRESRPGTITASFDCAADGVCHEARVHPAPIIGRKVTANP